MSRYLFLVRRDGQKAALPSAKRCAIRRRKLEVLAATLEGRIETFDEPFGGVDLYTVCQLPSNLAAARFASVLRREHHRPVHTVLLPPPPRNSLFAERMRTPAVSLQDLSLAVGKRQTQQVTL